MQYKHNQQGVRSFAAMSFYPMRVLYQQKFVAEDNLIDGVKNGLFLHAYSSYDCKFTAYCADTDD